VSQAFSCCRCARSSSPLQWCGCTTDSQERGSLVLPRAGVSPLVHPCLWLKSQQQVCWLQPGPLPVQQSFQPPAEVFLVGISLMGNPSAFLGSDDRIFFCLHSGLTSYGDLKDCHPQCPILVEGINTVGCCLLPQGDRS
jgi:hypothetical protein